MTLNIVDDRGSKDQRIIFDYLKQLYPAQNIYYEFPIHELNQRLDIYIPYLGLAIEYSGRQHYEFVEHFHKDDFGFNLSKFQDKKKAEYLIEKGIKLVEIPYNKMVASKEELKALIDSIEYPLDVYEILEDTNLTKKNKLKEQSNKRKEYLKKFKEKNDHSSN